MKSGRVCEFCGERLDRNDTFCKACGNVFIKDKDAKEAIIDDPNGNKKEFKINSDLVTYIGLTILAIIIVFLLVF